MPAAVQNNTGNGSISATVNEKASGVYSYAQRSLDWAVPPSSRQHAYDTVSAFASARPVLFSFLATQTLLSFFPILLFAAFSISCVVFALGAAIIFSLFWIGVALLVLVPTLLVTSSIAVLVWTWCIGSFVVARWLYTHAPFGVNAGVQVAAAGKQVSIVKDEKGLDGSVKDQAAEE
ncbi:hypothetical protein QQS21_008116 [Conoideocrella luteorostrata]|uniref:Uncharacterized protein n=1 Tax=Conoideocrella luteorostrata TaxID=1105319 RepID=A0AAJ0FRR1_9HYPO|nr:hypothetical protein QQS21_008116 [Conoideocrella luteorostrata]